ncbi:MAG: hypothetical protein KW793_02380 [Candidatus Doudnabacteria bacterium]|nr:hypothetical protein [Candidatus Doudnabacteria bacterium]
MAMTIFNSKKTEKLTNILNKARFNFSYDKNGIRNRLMINTEEHQMSMAEQKLRELAHKSFVRKHKIATALCLFLLIAAGSGAALAEADISKPGDKLHSFDQLGEQLLLKLPLTGSQKAKMRANIVDERNKELDYLIQIMPPGTIATQAVKESQESLSSAIEKTTFLKNNFASQGKQAQADKIDEVLKRLQILAQEQEIKVQGMLEKEENRELKRQLEDQIKEIRSAGERAGEGLKNNPR